MARKKKSVAPEYSFSEFLEHFEEAHRLGEQARAEGEQPDQMWMMIRILESMRERFPPDVAAYKAAKFTVPDAGTRPAIWEPAASPLRR